MMWNITTNHFNVLGLTQPRNYLADLLHIILQNQNNGKPGRKLSYPPSLLDLYPVYTEQNYLDRNLDQNLDRNPEDAPFYTGHSLLNITKIITLSHTYIAIHLTSGPHFTNNLTTNHNRISYLLAFSYVYNLS